ncbi:MAG: phasin family protein [Gammaproteobacteria bacterium]|jgi:hypothetical protein|nr:phasin family protein [Gammaproteobacteria bacterium]
MLQRNNSPFILNNLWSKTMTVTKTMNDTLHTMTDLTNKGMERMTSLGALNMGLFERMAAKQMTAMGMLMEHGNRMLTLTVGAKGYNELFKGQVGALQDLGKVVMEESRDNLALSGEVRGEYQSWFKKNLEEMQVDLRKVMPAV